MAKKVPKKNMKKDFVELRESNAKLNNVVSENISGKRVVKTYAKEEFEKLKQTPEDIESRLRLRGLVIAAQQVDSSIFPTIKKYAFDKNYKVN